MQEGESLSRNPLGKEGGHTAEHPWNIGITDLMTNYTCKGAGQLVLESETLQFP